MDELVDVAQSPRSQRVRARVVSTASFLAALCGRSACLQCGTAARACAARRRDGRHRGRARLAGPSDYRELCTRERTWGGRGPQKFRIACVVRALGDPTVIVQRFSYYIHIVHERQSASRTHAVSHTDTRAGYTPIPRHLLDVTTLRRVVARRVAEWATILERVLQAVDVARPPLAPRPCTRHCPIGHPFWCAYWRHLRWPSMAETRHVFSSHGQAWSCATMRHAR